MMRQLKALFDPNDILNPGPGAAGVTDFRAMRDGEEDAVIGLWEACGLTRPWNEPRRDLDFARGKSNSEILVASRNDRIIATVMAGHDGHRGTIYYLAVDPAEQGKAWAAWPSPLPSPG